MQVTGSWLFGINLRAFCFFIGYLSAIAGLVNIASHVIIVFLVTDGFQCDASLESLHAIPWNWLSPFLVAINLGSQGIFLFPFRSPFIFSGNDFDDDYMMATDSPRCYPWMLHVYIIDILYFLLNTIWLKCVLSFVDAIHKKDVKPMQFFLCMFMVKLCIHFLDYFFMTDASDVFSGASTYKIVDICIGGLFIIIIKKYIVTLKREMIEKLDDKPPSYIECLNVEEIQTEKKDTVILLEEKKEATDDKEDTLPKA